MGFLLVMAYALRTLSPNDIGLWYAMLGIVNVSLMAELGFNTTIGRFASFYLGGATRVPSTGLHRTEAGREPNMKAIAGLITMARRLYRSLGILTFVLTLILGAGWLALHAESAHLRTTHLIVFVILAAGAGFNMAILFWFGILFGLNKVRLHSQLMVLGLAVNYAVTFVCLMAGLGLYALAIGQILLNLIPRLASRRQVIATIPKTAFEEADHITWQAAWPMTWRAGALLLACNLCLQNLTLVCSLVSDLETTASFGLSLQLALMLHLFSATWIATRLPQISALRGQGAHQAVIDILLQRIPISMATYGVGAAGIFLVGPVLLSLLGSNTLLLPPLELGGLLIVVGLNLLVGLHSSVLQTGNEVPHLTVTVVSGVLTLVLGFLLGQWMGVRGIILSPFLAQVCCNYWYTPLICWRRLLHSDKEVA